MNFALFIAGAAVVSAQCDPHAPASSCLATNNCTFRPSLCFKSNSTFQCDTSSTTTCGASCIVGTTFMDYQTCSKCTPSCSTLTTEATCEDNPVCSFLNSSCFTTPPTPTICVSTTKNGCIAENNCVWADVSMNVCGVASGKGRCLHCTLFTVDDRSALKNYVGQTCTHAKAGSFSFAFSYTIKDFAQNGMCSATTNSTNATVDMAILATLAKSLLYNPYYTPFYDAASATATCVAAPADPSGASLLLPSAAFLSLAALLA